MRNYIVETNTDPPRTIQFQADDVVVIDGLLKFYKSGTVIGAVTSWIYYQVV